MTIKRDMIKLNMVIRRQGCIVKRWKLTDNQARALAPNEYFYFLMLAGKGRFFDIPIRVIR